MSLRHGARLAALLVPALLLAPAAAAHADSVTVDDTSGDAKAVNMAVALGGFFGPTSSEGPLFLDAPDETSADIVRTTVDHARKRLTLTVQFRDLVEVDGLVPDFRIFTSKGRYALPVTVMGGRASADLLPMGGQANVSVVVNEDGSVTVTETDVKRCRTVRARFDMAHDTVVASVPTACLGSPKWVQVAAGVLRTSVTPQADGSANIAGYVDDAFRSGFSEHSRGRSARVHRG